MIDNRSENQRFVTSIANIAFIISHLKLIVKRWSEAELFTIFENYDYTH